MSQIVWATNKEATRILRRDFRNVAPSNDPPAAQHTSVVRYVGTSRQIDSCMHASDSGQLSSRREKDDDAQLQLLYVLCYGERDYAPGESHNARKMRNLASQPLHIPGLNGLTMHVGMHLFTHITLELAKGAIRRPDAEARKSMMFVWWKMC